MSTDLEDFRQALINHAKVAVQRASRADNEAKTNAYLVQPILEVLGYNIGDPDEVSPEHHADFSEKYQNRVDYAILSDGAPVIAIESKRAGSILKDDRGQLRSYFNACQTVKLGILTDGVKYEFYADSDKPNMMDETAFLRFDLSEIAKRNSVDDNTLGGIAAIRRGSFNPENVGAEAKQKLLFDSIVAALKQFKNDPSNDFIRFMLSCPEAGNKIPKITQKIIDGNRDLVRLAMEAFVAQEALARFGYAPKDVVKTTPPEAVTVQPAGPTAVGETDSESITASEEEIQAFEYVKNRLCFLVRNDTLFSEVQKITHRKTKTSFRVYYVRPNNGSIFDYKEVRGKVVLQFPALGGNDIPYVPSAELDEFLLKAFTQRVKDAGVIFESAPVIRAITGGPVSGAA